MSRIGEITRTTRETDIQLRLDLDGTGHCQLHTGIGFFDHMLELFVRHGLFDLELHASGDLQVDQHHTVEDIGICLGGAFEMALGAKEGIRRYGHCILPMDEALVAAAIDLSGRPLLKYHVQIPAFRVGDFESELLEEFWRAFSTRAECTLHLHLISGRNSHHIAEAVFKAAARALRDACAIDPREQGRTPSTKGHL
jgi:imidazoleglycerol-phosphate dehydratase